MKKLLTLLLLAAMLLNCFVLSGFAEDTTQSTEATVLLEDDMIANKGSTQNYLDNGTAWVEQNQMLEAGEGSYLVYKVTIPATQGVEFRVDYKNWENTGNGGVHQYTSQPKYLCYVTSKEVAEDFDGNVTEWREVKATEKMALDTYSYTYSVDAASGYEQEETIYVCFKFAANDSSYEGQEGWNDSAWIEKITATAVPYTGIFVYDGSDNSAWETGVEDNETPRSETDETPAICYDFSMPAGGVGAEDITATFNLDMLGKKYDVSDMDFIVFDIYVTDKVLVSATEFCLELTSSGMPDEQENEYVGCFGGLGDGWNTVVVRLGSFQVKEMDKTSFNYFRLFNTNPISSDEEFVFKIDNIRFEKAAEIQSDYDGPVEEHIFFVLDNDTELDYMINCTAQSSGTAFRFCDTNSEVVYKFTVANRYSANKVLFSAMLSQQLLLQVSQDGESWETVYEYDYDPSDVPHQGIERVVMEFDLTSYLDLLQSADVYIRIADAFPSNGWGGTIHSDMPTILSVQYTELTPEEWDEHESAADDRSISFMTCSVPFGSFVTDTMIKTAGYSSLMLSVGENSINATTFAPVDATGYDSLEFDLFIANPSFLEAEFADAGIELSSQGTNDNGELGWSLADILATQKIKEGWNHITLFFRDGKPDNNNTVDFDPTAINFLRIFFVGTPTKYQGATFGIDNLRLTKAAAELDAELARKDQEAADDVIEKINAIGEVTTKSSSKIKRAQKAYDKLTDAQKALVTNYQALVEATAKYEELTNPPKTDEEQKPDDEQQKPDDEQTPNNGNTQTPDEGCASVLTVGTATMLLFASAWVAIATRKKEN